MKSFLEKSFPQIDFNTFLYDQQELFRYAQAPPGSFPKAQFVTKMYKVLFSPTTTPTHRKTAVCAVALAGDAAHAFPPDLGQGVNCGLDDVYCLHQALQECQNNLPLALEQYEKHRAPEGRAICKLVQFAAPYQYQQAPLLLIAGGLNVKFRHTLHKMFPWLFSPAAGRIIWFIIYDTAC